jgi:hypothetical protein
MKKRWSVGVSLCFLTLGPTALAQDVLDPRSDQLSDNKAKLVVTLKLDREVYLPGELGQLTITVQNPTAQDLEIWKPFVSETGTVGLLQKGNVSARAYGLEYGPVSPGPDIIEPPGPPPPGPTVTIRSGEQLVKTLQFFDKILGETPDTEMLFAGSAPPWSGDYRVVYWGQSADFHVVTPVFEGSVKIDLPDVEVLPAVDGTPRRIQFRTYAFALGYGEKHFICVERVPYPQDANRVEADQQGRVADLGLPFSRYSRFAESDEPIRMLRGESDAAGDLMLAWQQSDGDHRLNLARTEWQIPSLKFGQ